MEEDPSVLMNHSYSLTAGEWQLMETNETRMGDSIDGEWLKMEPTSDLPNLPDEIGRKLLLACQLTSEGSPCSWLTKQDNAVSRVDLDKQISITPADQL